MPILATKTLLRKQLKTKILSITLLIIIFFVFCSSDNNITTKPSCPCSNNYKHKSKLSVCLPDPFILRNKKDPDFEK
jgi:hypothetical protein